jgi:hypothetical protein
MGLIARVKFLARAKYFSLLHSDQVMKLMTAHHPYMAS